MAQSYSLREGAGKYAAGTDDPEYWKKFNKQIEVDEQRHAAQMEQLQRRKQLSKEEAQRTDRAKSAEDDPDCNCNTTCTDKGAESWCKTADNCETGDLTWSLGRWRYCDPALEKTKAKSVSRPPYAGRQAPDAPAKDFKLGTIRTGKDDRAWKVTKTKRGLRWMRVKK